MKDDPDEMRDEYDFAPEGGVRGKYYERYRAAMGLDLPDSPLIAKNTSAGSGIGSITRPLTWPTPYPSPSLQIGPADSARQVHPR